jgi:hypothetical protein
MMVTIMLVTPIPSAKARTEAAENQRSFAKSRAANLASCAMSSSHRVPRVSRQTSFS